MSGRRGGEQRAAVARIERGMMDGITEEMNIVPEDSTSMSLVWPRVGRKACVGAESNTLSPGGNAWGPLLAS
jgi:hypothetical protein